jgi:hypothetical protein
MCKINLSKQQNEILEYLKTVGITKDEFYTKLSSGLWIQRNIYKDEEQRNKLESIRHFAFATQTPETYYYYDAKPEAKFDGGGVLDDKSRDFCVEVIALSKFWSKSEINQLSFRLRTSVFRLSDGMFTNCRHQWVAVQTVRDSKVLDREKNRMIKAINSPEDLYN